ncbi:hypothetical protein NDU88_004001 [Pleurodeles waltl]|uniref:Uncharacterized protein n=1 Tax=Pleurodeles waltl TaxID=8319 RepID=A0AAV7LN42_PLEWA|nr:hypothetical protein NDU88_004001 [Pleurodeles waltl]
MCQDADPQRKRRRWAHNPNHHTYPRERPWPYVAASHPLLTPSSCPLLGPPSLLPSAAEPHHARLGSRCSSLPLPAKKGQMCRYETCLSFPPQHTKPELPPPLDTPTLPKIDLLSTRSSSLPISPPKAPVPEYHTRARDLLLA